MLRSNTLKTVQGRNDFEELQQTTSPKTTLEEMPTESKKRLTLSETHSTTSMIRDQAQLP